MQLTDLDKVSAEVMQGQGEPKTQEEMMSMWERQKKIQIKENRGNEKLRNRLLHLAEEGDTFGYFG
jgi:hypothetical protein